MVKCDGIHFTPSSPLLSFPREEGRGVEGVSEGGAQSLLKWGGDGMRRTTAMKWRFIKVESGSDFITEVKRRNCLDRMFPEKPTSGDEVPTPDVENG